MSASPLVSVILPLYNAAAHVEAAVANIAAQTQRDIELIMIDDASSDDTRARAEAACAGLAFPASVIALARNGGAAAARNAGLDRARGRYIAFYDADDRWRPDKLALQVAALEADDALVLVACQGQWWLAEGRKGGCVIAADLFGRDDLWRQLFTDSFVSTPCTMLRASALGDARFDTSLRIAEDRDLWLRVGATGKIGLIDTVLVDIHYSPESLLQREGARAGSDALRMIRASLARFGHRLTAAERRRALGRAYYELGEPLTRAPGGYARGAAALVRAAALGFRPGFCLRHALLSAPPLRALRQAGKASPNRS